MAEFGFNFKGGVDFRYFTIADLTNYKYYAYDTTSIGFYNNQKNATVFSGSGLSFTGSLENGDFECTGGTIDTIGKMTSGAVVEGAQNLNLSAQTLFDYAMAGDDESFLFYLISGNDTITGTASSDYLIGGRGKRYVVRRCRQRRP